MRLRPEDLGVEGLETDGFVPMLKCGDYSKHITCTEPECIYAREISEVYKDLGLLEEVDNLPEEQHDKLYGVICRSLHHPLQKDFLEAGFNAIKEIISFDGKNCAYAAVRGSTSRGAATEGDDVDLFIISDTPKKTKEYASEISNEEGKRLKEMHPETKRRGLSLVAPVIIPYDFMQDFIDDPLNIDSHPRYVETQYVDPENVAMMHMYLQRKFDVEQILDDAGKDPFRFATEAVYPPNGKVTDRRIFGLNEKERTHNMIALLTRLYGSQVHGDVPQFHVTRLRDAYLFDVFREVLGNRKAEGNI
jgi:predicted nucleotidyltransferase